MNSAARANLPTLNLDKFKHYRWFKKNKGKKRMKERPLLTDEHKRTRQVFAERLHNLRAEGAVICYLDEKCFYLFSQCYHAKHLPRADFEEEKVDRRRVRHVIS